MKKLTIKNIAIFLNILLAFGFLFLFGFNFKTNFEMSTTALLGLIIAQINMYGCANMQDEL